MTLTFINIIFAPCVGHPSNRWTSCSSFISGYCVVLQNLDMKIEFARQVGLTGQAKLAALTAEGTR
jgi:hypothetical protein